MLAAKKQQLLDKLQALPDPHQRLLLLTDAARRRPPVPQSIRVADNLIEGCVADLWLAGEFRDGCCSFQCDSESLTVRAMAGLLCDFYSGETPAEILETSPDFLREAGLGAVLTANRRSALSKVWKRIYAFAEKHRDAADS